MAGESLGTGVVLGFGATNARFGVAQEGDITGFKSIATPEKPREFFGWMAGQLLDAASDGHNWMVAGFPGPVEDEFIGPMVNVPSLSTQRYDLLGELINVQPEIDSVTQGGFTLVAVNDGELAAQAAAVKVGESTYSKVAALILGTGVGAGIVELDETVTGLTRVYRVDSNPNEIGHVLLSDDPHDTFENAISGPALTQAYDMDSRDIPSDSYAWIKVGRVATRMVSLLGVMNGVELVVPCGGVGSGAYEKYGQHLQRLLDSLGEYGNGVHKKFLPEVIPVPAKDAQIFELFGGEGVMRDFTTRS